MNNAKQFQHIFTTSGKLYQTSLSFYHEQKQRTILGAGLIHEGPGKNYFWAIWRVGGEFLGGATSKEWGGAL